MNNENKKGIENQSIGVQTNKELFSSLNSPSFNNPSVLSQNASLLQYSPVILASDEAEDKIIYNDQ